VRRIYHKLKEKETSNVASFDESLVIFLKDVTHSIRKVLKALLKHFHWYFRLWQSFLIINVSYQTLNIMTLVGLRQSME